MLTIIQQQNGDWVAAPDQPVKIELLAWKDGTPKVVEGVRFSWAGGKANVAKIIGSTVQFHVRDSAGKIQEFETTIDAVAHVIAQGKTR